MSKISKKTRIISKMLTPEQLSRLGEDDVDLDAADFLHREPGQGASPFFLGYYSREGIRWALKKYGVFDDLKKRGYEHLHLAINTEDPFKQRISIFNQEDDRRLLLVDIVLRRKHFRVKTPFQSQINGRSFEFLFIEWIALQDPHSSFTPDRTRLPGQEFPGLRRGKITFELLFISCKRLRLAGMLSIPEFFHNAEIYSKTFHFLNPELEGKRRAISRDLLAKNSLAEVSWAINLECVKENGKSFSWFTSEVIMPINFNLQDYFSSEDYKEFEKAAFEKYSYALDMEQWEKKKSQIETLR